MAFELYRGILADCGVVLTADTRILDFGCGAGALVAEGRKAGYQTFGCDFETEAPHCSRIETPYRLPFPDQSFDVLLSATVMEHVMDYDMAIAETRRILKPGGAFLHIFPSRGTPIEQHVFVPLATVIRARPWLLFWAFLGVRNQFQAGMSPWERATRNHRYLRAHTNYMGRRKILRNFGKYFREIREAEASFLKVRGHRLIPAWLYRALRAHVLLGRFPKPTQEIAGSALTK